MRTFYILIVVAFAFSCSKKEAGPQCANCADQPSTSQQSDVLITNEGNFGTGNGSLTLYKPASNSVSNGVFNQINGFPLGDIVNSVAQVDNKAYIVVNNSGKIEVANIDNFTSITTITGFTSPRFFLPIDNNKAYVTDLFSNSIQIVDLTSNTISGSITTYGWTEQMKLYNDTVYACDMTNDNLLIINPLNNTLVDSVKVGKGPNSMAFDQNNKLWILCDGGYNDQIPVLKKYNPQTRTVEATFTFANVAESPNNIAINSTGDQLYFINTNVYAMNITDLTLPGNPIITSNNNTFYGLGIDPINDDIYLSDAVDYVQNGVVFRYNKNVALIHQFNTSVIPGRFLFVQ